MKEKAISITEARAQLTTLSKNARKKMARVIMTNRGEAESVLLGINDYRGLVATAELVQRPDIIAALSEAVMDVKEGRTITMKEARNILLQERDKAKAAVAEG